MACLGRGRQPCCQSCICCLSSLWGVTPGRVKGSCPIRAASLASKVWLASQQSGERGDCLSLSCLACSHQWVSHLHLRPPQSWLEVRKMLKHHCPWTGKLCFNNCALVKAIFEIQNSKTLFRSSQSDLDWSPSTKELFALSRIAQETLSMRHS